MKKDDILVFAMDDPRYGERVTEAVNAAGHETMLWLIGLSAATKREECARITEQAGIDGLGTIAAALKIRTAADD